MNGSGVSVLISDVGMSGTEHSIHRVPWRAWNGAQPASMEYHGELGAEYGYVELVRRGGVETWQLPWSPMGSAVWILDILMEYHEKSELWGIVTPAEFCWAYPWINVASVFNE